MATEENPHAGQGAVVLDIGGDVGALIVEMPAHMEDLEVEIIPTGTDSRPTAAASHDHPHAHDGDHAGAHDHDHAGAHDHDHDHASAGAHDHDHAGAHDHDHAGAHDHDHDHASAGAHDHDHAGAHDHDHAGAHDHDHAGAHDHDHDHPHEHAAGAPPHVAVVARPTPDGSTIYSLVYEIVAGTYDLYVRPHGPIRLTATVAGGEVTQERWPDWESPN